MRRASPNKRDKLRGPLSVYIKYLDSGTGRLANFTALPKNNNALVALGAPLII